MKFQTVIAAAALSFASVQASAQATVSPQCSAVITQDLCQKTVDIFQFVAPQLGAVIAGGNATLGVGGTLGGPGHIYVTGRATVVNSVLPLAAQIVPSASGANSDEYPTQNELAGIPQADVAIGVFKGIPLGVTNVGGIDLLGSVSYMPTINTSGLRIGTPNGSFKFGGGVRVGIVQESIVFPGISVTYLRRGLPTVDIQGESIVGDSMHIRDVNVTTDSYRIVASKNLLALGVAAGVGQDRYNTSAVASGYMTERSIGGIDMPGTSVGPIALNQKLTRTTYFVDATLNLALVKLIGELGRTGGVNIPTYNSFASSTAGAAQTFGAIGIRFGM
jgi:hypothetical protein